jgi:hypothetical protein
MRGKNNGSAVIALLVAIVVVALLYFIDLSSIFGPIDKGAAYSEKPWFEEQRLVNHFPVKQTGKGGKAIILNQLTLESPVTRHGTERGNIKIIIEPNGLAQGHWQCSYEHPEDKSKYNITADFKGNIDPTKTYCDPNGYNKKLLYMITKGKYKEIRTDASNLQWPREAVVYVVGWIDKNRSARGKVFLMTDDTEAHGNAEYDWKTN